MYPRFLTQPLTDALSDSPVVLVIGARQVGKTTLARQAMDINQGVRYVTLDDEGFLSAARADPAGFLAGLGRCAIIDEIQHAPELFPAIKASVDRDRAPGRFLLTGSANVLVLPRLSESLAGRMEILTLWPLAQAEIEGGASDFVDRLFGETMDLGREYEPITRDALLGRILAGGYPEPLGRASQARRRAWFNSYLTTILQRDVRNLSNIEGLTQMPRLMSLLAARMASLLNSADISRGIGVPYTTLNRYMSLLEATFLLRLLPAWTANLNVRLTKSPKVMINDTGLAASLLGLDLSRLQSESVLLGQLLENFVTMEVMKLAGVSVVQPQLFHYRTTAGAEVDLLLEDAAGRLVGIEVKATATVTSGDFRGLRTLDAAAPGRLHRGIVLYTGPHVIPFGDRLFAVPIQALWSGSVK
jgi:predicted AAA+ superfamily ATPase